MKIVKRTLIGYQPVYDIGLAEDHNFLLANGTIASNCFNKSHSVAYGYITYQTAYLKANFPVEYMSALLSSVSGDREKVQKYIANAKSMGIEVLPPDINQSGVDFTPVGGNIRFGLAAIKNLGLGAIEAIIEARGAGGHFTSLADLCYRVDSRALNKKGLEALIQAGAMDSIFPNRRHLLAELDIVLESASRRAKEIAIGQGSLFDFTGKDGTLDFSATPTGPVPDFSPTEKLELEKELLGFYLSDHPLKEISESARLLAPTNIGDIKEVSPDQGITAIAMLTEVKQITTKKGDRMAVIQIEDLTGSIGGVVFPKSYERIKACLQKDQRLMIWGKVDRRDEEKELQIIIDYAQPIEDVQLLTVELSPDQALNLQELHRLREILLAHAPQAQTDKDITKIPVVASLRYSDKFVCFASQFWVKDVTQTYQALLSAGFSARSESILAVK